MRDKPFLSVPKTTILTLGVGFISFGLWFISGCNPAVHQSPTPTPLPEELISFFETWNAAVESGDVGGALEYFAEGATLETVGYYHLISNGKDEIRTALEYWIGSGYVHLVDEYEFSNDEEAMYWDLEFGGDNNFCHGKVVVRSQEIVYLGFSTC